MCIFAFINGWSFALKNVSWKEAFWKIKKLLLNYWYIEIPALVIAMTICGYALSPTTIFKEFLGLSSTVMIFAWYVPFYCISTLVMTALQNLLNKNIGIGVIVGILFPIIIFAALGKLPLSNEIKKMFNNTKHWFPCISIGFMSYKYEWLQKIDRALQNVNRYAVSILFIGLCFISRYFISALDFVYGLLLVYAIVNLKINVNSIVGRAVYLCGKNSSNMWFLHCLYFGEATRNVVQPLAFFVKNPILIYIIAVFELIVVSEMINLIRKKVHYAIFDNQLR